MNITLDDFGLNKSANREIYKWTQTKKVDFVSLITNLPSTEEAIRLYKKDKVKRYGLGLHFNIVEGKPISKKNEVPSLVNKKGYFHLLPLFILRLFFGMIKKEDVMKELQKQYDVIKNAQISCMHINSHQNIHVFHFMYSCVNEFAQKNDIRHIRQVASVKNRFRKFPLTYIVFIFLYLVSSLIFASYDYKPAQFIETSFHPGTTYD